MPASGANSALGSGIAAVTDGSAILSSQECELQAVKILHVTRIPHTLSFGGLQRYLLDLIDGLLVLGHDSATVWLHPLEQAGPLVSNGVRVVPVYATHPHRCPTDTRATVLAFEKVLSEEKPDLLHFHTFSFNEATLAREAFKRGIPYAFTYHGPPANCRRRTLIRPNGRQCDGKVRGRRCSACLLQERFHIPLCAAEAMAIASVPLGATFGRILSGRLGHCLRVTATMREWGKALREFLEHCSLATSYCEWVSEEFARAAGSTPARRVKGPVVIGFVGRVVPDKGVHILMHAFGRTSYEHARLRIRGWDEKVAAAAYPRYAAELRRLAQGDARMDLLAALPRDRIIEEYRELTILAVPSVWMETGPLVIPEAMAAGVPVYSSRNVGQLQLLEEHGRAVDPNTPEEWERVLEELFAAHREGRLETALKIPKPRSIPAMVDVAAEMAVLYERLCSASGIT